MMAGTRSFILGPEARSRIVEPTFCAARDLRITLRDRRPASAAARAYLVTVDALDEDDKRRVVAHTPYPVGEDSSFVVPSGECGSRGLSIALHPVHPGEPLSQVEVEVAAETR